MYTQKPNTLTKTIVITVNGEPVGRKLIIDSVTFAPVSETECTFIDKMESDHPMI
ncbi:MAG: hypothetical protein IKE29_21715 [Paenibacillus sp.]|uniref:hypothetical protein n=1 Tax=Paenibacillus sp. TaxID=58172 RepID=UPI0025F1A833|nr:hypothetical protein [Paenibacillus sp.]MBR2567209.1 hypothetical protein [Paenibacillus sp.]